MPNTLHDPTNKCFVFIFAFKSNKVSGLTLTLGVCIRPVDLISWERLTITFTRSVKECIPLPTGVWNKVDQLSHTLHVLLFTAAIVASSRLARAVQQSSVFYLGPLYQHGIDLIPAWVNNHTPIRCEMKLLSSSRFSTVTPLKIWIRQVISSHTIWWM